MSPPTKQGSKLPQDIARGKNGQISLVFRHIALVYCVQDSCVAGLGCRPDVVATQMPANTVTMPPTRFQPIGSCSSIAPTSDAVTGLTVTEIATRVGVVRASANAHR